MAHRQPEIGSALGYGTDEMIARCDARLAHLAEVRQRLISELAKAELALEHGEAPEDITRRLQAIR